MTQSTKTTKGTSAPSSWWESEDCANYFATQAQKPERPRHPQEQGDYRPLVIAIGYTAPAQS